MSVSAPSERNPKLAGFFEAANADLQLKAWWYAAQAVADALDMTHGRSRVPFERGRPNIHSLSAAAIDEVALGPGEDRAVRIEIAMNNSSGLFQVDELLATKLRGSGIEEHVEVIARIDAEHEKRLVPVFTI